MKQISLTSSRIKNLTIERDGDVILVTVVGVGLDASGNEYSALNLVTLWEDLPVQVKNAGDNFIKHLSREFNKDISNEDVETW